jgi:hypothetical protein
MNTAPPSPTSSVGVDQIEATAALKKLREEREW